MAEVCKRKLIHGDNLEVLPTLREGRVDAVVTDPPYALSFMGAKWDGELPGLPTWKAVLRVLKPGGYALIFGGTRTYHRLACAVEDAGFELRDCIMWLYATGFPKGQGNLKPAYEPILLCRKPGPKVLPLGIDEARVPGEVPQVTQGVTRRAAEGQAIYGQGRDIRRAPQESNPSPLGRYPANICHDGSDEVLEAFAAFGERRSCGDYPSKSQPKNQQYLFFRDGKEQGQIYADTGTAARFFFCAKASRRERGDGNTHTTVKPLALIRWLVRLACPAGGTVLDPFLGSGTTMVAAIMEDRHSIGIEREAEYVEIARNRVVKAECKRRARLV